MAAERDAKLLKEWNEEMAPQYQEEFEEMYGKTQLSLSIDIYGKGESIVHYLTRILVDITKQCKGVTGGVMGCTFLQDVLWRCFNPEEEQCAWVSRVDYIRKSIPRMRFDTYIDIRNHGLSCLGTHLKRVESDYILVLCAIVGMVDHEGSFDHGMTFMRVDGEWWNASCCNIPTLGISLRPSLRRFDPSTFIENLTKFLNTSVWTTETTVLYSSLAQLPKGINMSALEGSAMRPTVMSRAIGLNI